MRKYKPRNMSILSKVYEWGGKPYLCVTMLAGFLLEETPRLLSEKETWDRISAALGPAPLDSLLPKKHCEYLLYGDCYAPKGEHAEAVMVACSVGQARKELLVHGDRWWHNTDGTDGFSEPQPFTSMPLSYSLAFGGPGYSRNPVGKGVAPVELPTGGVGLPLPNIELPQEQVFRVEDRPAPGCFGPLDVSWSPRVEKQGVFDKTWVKKWWPGFPPDMDKEFFNTAPQDQQLELIAADAPLTLENVHPEKSRIQSRLPNLRARCWLSKQKTPDPQNALKEVESRLETLWLLPGQELGVALYRAVTPVGDDEGLDVAFVVADWEEASVPSRPEASYREMLLKRLSRLPDEELPEKPETPPPPVPPAVEKARADLAEKKKQPKAPTTLERMKAMAAGAGVDMEKVFPQRSQASQADKDIFMQKSAEARQTLSAKKAEVEDRIAASGRPLPQPISTLTQETLAAALSVKAPTSAKDAFAGVPERLLQAKARGDAALERAKEKLERPEAKKLSVDDVLAGYAQGERFAGLDLSDLDFSGLELPGIHLEDANLSNSVFAGADLQGADMSGALLTKTDFTKTKLRNALFNDAQLEKAVFTEAHVSGADFSRAMASKADFSKANLSGAKLDALQGDGMLFSGAVLDDASLNKADFTEAEMSGASLQRAKVTDATFENAVLNGADFQDAAGLRPGFEAANLAQARLNGVQLDRAGFAGASLDQCDFSDATLPKASFKGATGKGARFTRAKLINARGGEATMLEEADFTDADLRNARFMQAKLPDVDFTGAQMQESNFSGCDLRNSRLHGVNALKARFVHADFRGGDARGGHFLFAKLGKADLRKADFRDAHCFMAELFRIKVDENTLLDGAALGRTFLALKDDDEKEGGDAA